MTIRASGRHRPSLAQDASESLRDGSNSTVFRDILTRREEIEAEEIRALEDGALEATTDPQNDPANTASSSDLRTVPQQQAEFRRSSVRTSRRSYGLPEPQSQSASNLFAGDGSSAFFDVLTRRPELEARQRASEHIPPGQAEHILHLQTEQPQQQSKATELKKELGGPSSRKGSMGNTSTGIHEKPPPDSTPDETSILKKELGGPSSGRVTTVNPSTGIHTVSPSPAVTPPPDDEESGVLQTMDESTCEDKTSSVAIMTAQCEPLAEPSQQSFCPPASCTEDASDREANLKQNHMMKLAAEGKQRRLLYSMGFALLLVTIAIIIGVIATQSNNKEEENTDTTPLSPTTPPLTAASPMDSSSPQAKAQAWLNSYPRYNSLPKWKRDQLRGLAVFYYAFDGEHWPLLLWDRNNWLDYAEDECDWYAASKRHSSCNELGAFTSLNLDSLQPELTTVAVIPTEIALLSSLEKITLGFDMQMPLDDFLPWQELSQLTLLDTLHLASNHFSGNLPSELGQLTALTALIFEGNQLTGPIPSELGRLSLLKRLILSMNELTGALPTEVGLLTQLEELTLTSNQLSGSIPIELGRLSWLFDLRLFDNRLTGQIPSELAQLQSLWRLGLNDNELSRVIPSEFGTFRGLTILSLANNKDLSGTIPPELGNAAKLSELDLSNLPRMTGTLPPDLVVQLSSLNLVGSAGVTGTIPESACRNDRVKFDCSDALCGCDCPCSPAT